MVSLVSIDYLNQSAELHIMIGDKENRGKGAGTFAVKEMLSHAFTNLNLHRIGLTVLADNERAKHLYKMCGFRCEGCMRQSKYKRGEFVDLSLIHI